jgi:putative phage-type endonuclease
MKKLILTPTKTLSEQQWQELRSSFVNRGMVGGSDAGVLFGLSQYKSPINLFYQAIGLVNLPNKMNSAMLHGKQLEEYVAKCWQYFDGTEDGWVENTLADNKIKKYRKVRAIIENPKYPALFANIDGMITKHPDYNKKGVLEIKTISGYSSDSWESGFPPTYLVQLQHYMLVTGMAWGEICYLKDGRQIGCVTFEADKEIQDKILERANAFRNMVLQAREAIEGVEDADHAYNIAAQFEPGPDKSEAYNDFISERHKQRQTETVVTASEEDQLVADRYVKTGLLLKKLDAQKTFLQSQLKKSMGDAQVMMLNDGKITWRKQFIVTKK